MIAPVVLVGLLLALSAPSPGYSETRELFGILFPVDKVKEVSGGHVEIVLDGVTTVVPAQYRDRVIVEHYFRPQAGNQGAKSSEFSPAEISQFISGAVKAGRWELGLYPLRFLATHSKDDPTFFNEMVVRVGALPQGESLLLGYIRTQPLDVEHAAALIEAAFLASARSAGGNNGPSNPSNPINAGPSFDLAEFVVGKIGVDASKAAILELLVRSIVHNEVWLKDACFELAGQSIVQSALKESIASLRQISRVPETSTRLGMLLGFADERFAEKADFSRIFAAPVIQEVGALIEQKRFEDALVLLAEYPFARRTPDLRRALIEILSTAQREQPGVVLRPRVFQFLQVYAREDKEVLIAARDLVRASVLLFIEKGELNRLGPYWKLIEVLDPAPSKVKAELQYEFIKRSFELGAMDAERTSFMQELPLLLRVKSYLLSAYHSIPLFETLLGILVIGSGMLLIRWRVRSSVAVAPPRDSVVRPVHEPIVNEDRRRRFVHLATAPRYRDPRIDEYFECLATLGVAQGSSISEIKAAYRHLAKAVHPDVHTDDQDKRASDDFMKLKSAYMRLLDLEQDSSFIAILDAESGG